MSAAPDMYRVDVPHECGLELKTDGPLDEVIKKAGKLKRGAEKRWGQFRNGKGRKDEEDTMPEEEETFEQAHPHASFYLSSQERMNTMQEELLSQKKHIEEIEQHQKDMIQLFQQQHGEMTKLHEIINTNDRMSLTLLTVVSDVAELRADLVHLETLKDNQLQEDIAEMKAELLNERTNEVTYLEEIVTKATEKLTRDFNENMTDFAKALHLEELPNGMGWFESREALIPKREADAFKNRWNQQDQLGSPRDHAKDFY